MIEVRNLTKKFGSNLSLDDVSMDLNMNDSIALMGANGAGKTTLVRSILGYYHPTSGSIKIDGLNPIGDREEVLKNIAFVPQLPPPIKLSINELIKYVEISSDIKREEIFYYAEEMRLDIKNNMKKSFFKLSGGMKQKLLIAISLSKNNKILIFDEPTANLDPKARDDFYRLLKGQQKGKILLFVTHRLDEVKGLINREIHMDMGKVIKNDKI